MINNAMHVISVTTEDTSLQSNSYLYVIVWQCSHTSQLFEGHKYSFFGLVMIIVIPVYFYIIHLGKKDIEYFQDSVIFTK